MHITQSAALRPSYTSVSDRFWSVAAIRPPPLIVAAGELVIVFRFGDALTPMRAAQAGSARSKRPYKTATRLRRSASDPCRMSIRSRRCVAQAAVTMSALGQKKRTSSGMRRDNNVRFRQEMDTSGMGGTCGLGSACSGTSDVVHPKKKLVGQDLKHIIHIEAQEWSTPFCAFSSEASEAVPMHAPLRRFGRTQTW
jgi:hypothetical protein